MCSLICSLVVLIPLVATQAPGDGSSSCQLIPSDGTRVLLDSFSYETLLPTPWMTLDLNNDSITWQMGVVGGLCSRSVGICSNTSSVDYLVTQHIDASLTQQANLIVQFTEDSSCTHQCNSDFNVLIYHTQAVDIAGSTSIANYVSLGVAVDNIAIPISVISMGFYLAFEGNSTCAVISRVQVTYRVCEATLNMFANYSATASGKDEQGMCVMNAMPAGSLLATCPSGSSSFDFSSAGGCECKPGYGSEVTTPNQCDECVPGRFKSAAGNSACQLCPDNSNSDNPASTECACNLGYERATSDVSSPCSVCVADYFRSGGECNPCPDGSTSGGGAVSQCNCLEGRVTQQGNSITSSASDPCNTCNTGYYRSAPEMCMSCPPGSERNFSATEDAACFCVGNGATNQNSPNTMGLPCEGCRNGYYRSPDGTCILCPSNSNSTSFDDDVCSCNSGTVLVSGGDETTSEPCAGCDAGYFRLDDSCITCPNNTVRESATDDESSCRCVNSNYRRRNLDITMDCLPVVGFTSTSIMLTEGSAKNISLVLSATTYSPVNVPLAPTTVGGPLNIAENVAIPPNSLMSMVELSSTGNDIALERDTVIDVRITEPSTPNFVVGGTTESETLYSSINVVIQDDDVVGVGFTEDSLSINESTSSSKVTLMTTQSIASDLELRISGVELPVQIDNTDITLAPGPFRSTEITFDIRDDSIAGQEDRVVTLELQYVGPQEFTDSVMIGGDNTFSRIRITIIDDDTGGPTDFPLTAIIGIACGGAGLAVLLLVIIILCLCICRLRVNRQGFYPTYEDKTSEPPTMLRYSASLRSISSQTVIPAAEGRSVTKENEFYV